MKSLNENQKRILAFLQTEMADGNTPSIREICSATGISSTSTVHSHLNTLEKLGYITKGHGHRGLKLVGGEPMVAVPIVGRVTAGLPVYAFEDIEGYVQYPKNKVSADEMFALRVVGESMRDIGILDGDVVVCEKNPSANNGDIVVALIEDEATVKSFYAEDGHYRLQPHNPDFEPIIVDEVTVLGKVVSLSREY